MEAVVLVIHLMLALAMIAVILVQQSEGGGLGIGGGGGGMGGFATARGTANFLTRMTTILAVCFFSTSLGLAVIAKNNASTRDQSILELVEQPAEEQPAAVSEDVTVPLAGEKADDVRTTGEVEDAADEDAPAVPISE